MINAQQPPSEAFKELIARIQSGDRMAFDEFFARYDPKVRSVIRNRLRNYHQKLRSLYETGDFSNDIWSTLWQRMPALSVEDESDFFWQLNRIAEDKIIDASRKQSARKRNVAREERIYPGIDGSSGMELASHEPTPSKYAIATELGEAIDSKSANLGEEFQLICRLKKENYSNHEIAQATGMHVRKIQRGLKLIQEKFHSYFQEPGQNGK